MQNIKIICIGKLNAAYFNNAANEYKKRLNAFCKLEIVELAECNIQEKAASAANIEKALDKESEAILGCVIKGSYKICLCIEGEQLSSEELADYISGRAVSGNGNITFIIGSSHGLSRKLKDACDKKMSMSRLTFPHQLARVMLLEQLYRAFSIIKGIKYHK